MEVYNANPGTHGMHEPAMDEPRRYWFPAKRHGWGWGPPATWQGWTSVLVYCALEVAGVFLFPPGTHRLGFFIYTGGITAAFLGVCYAKGEPPAWRWDRN